MTVSMVLPTYSHALQLDGTLYSVLMQTRQPDQIIIVEDGDSDGGRSRAVCEKWKNSLPVEYYQRVNRPNKFYSSPAIPLNCAIKKATGDILLLWDDCCKCTKPTDVEKLVGPVEENPSVTTYAVVKHLSQTGNNPQPCFPYAQPDDKFFNRLGQAIRRDVVLAMGGFEESWVSYGGDDCEFQDRLYRWNSYSMVITRIRDVEIHHQWHAASRTDAELPLYEENCRIYSSLSAQKVANEGKEWGRLDS